MLRKLFKKSALTPNDELVLTFKHRSKLFWDWFSKRCDAFYQAIEDQNFDPYTQEVTQKMEELLPELAWVFGPGDNNEGHSFTISPEGDPYKAFLCTYLVKMAPVLKGWTFYDSRQASPTFEGMRMEIVGQSVTAQQIWVAPSVDIDREQIDLVCWNPIFSELPEHDRGQITFLWLDEALGEFTVENRLGAIDINDSALTESMPLTELPSFIEGTEAKQGWKKKIPGEYYTGYQIAERADFQPSFLRSDIFTGTSLLWQISRDYGREDGQLPHPLPHLGVDFIFIVIPRKHLTPGKEIDERSDLEDLLQTSFKENTSGFCLGGASGNENTYLDIIILDGQRGVQTLLETLNTCPLGKHCSVHYFDKNRTKTPIS